MIQQLHPLPKKEGRRMVYEMRVYTLQPGKVPEFQALIENEALPVISSATRGRAWKRVSSRK